MGVPDADVKSADAGGGSGLDGGVAGGDLLLEQDLISRIQGLLQDHANALQASAMPTTPEALLRGIVCAMCDYPDCVRFDQHITKYSASFDVHLHESDVSKVLGIGGSHATALRVLFSAIYGKQGKKLYLMVVNPHHRR